MDVVHPVADHDIGAVVEFGDEPRDLGEVVGQIGIGHDDVLALGDGEAGQVCAAIAALGLADHVRAGRLRQRGASVFGVVVGDDHLAGEVGVTERLPGPLHAFLDVVGLVQARDHDRDCDRQLGIARLGLPGALFVGRAHGSVCKPRGWIGRS